MALCFSRMFVEFSLKPVYLSIVGDNLWYSDHWKMHFQVKKLNLDNLPQVLIATLLEDGSDSSPPGSVSSEICFPQATFCPSKKGEGGNYVITRPIYENFQGYGK